MPSAKFTQEITLAIKDCGAFLFLLTVNSANDSEFVENELIEARYLKKKRFVIQYDKAEPGDNIRLLINNVQSCPVEPSTLLENITNLAHAIISELHVVTHPPHGPIGVPNAPPPNPRRWTFSIVISVVVAVAAAAVCWGVYAHDPNVMYVKGRRYFAAGQTEQAFALWRSAASRGQRDACLALGKELITGRYSDKALREGISFLQSLARTKDAEAGEILENGITASKDPDSPGALDRLRAFADAGIPSAEHLLAGYLFQEDPTNSESVTLLERAAEAGDFQAMRDLGLAYFLGKGVKEDNRQALRWIRQAAAGNDQIAKNNLQQVEAYAQADEAFAQDSVLANAGDLQAKVRVGQYFLQLKHDPVMGVKYFEEAANAGSAEAMCDLAKCYLNGIGVSVDRAKATDLYKQAADLGSELGKHNYQVLQNKSSP